MSRVKQIFLKCCITLVCHKLMIVERHVKNNYQNEENMIIALIIASIGFIFILATVIYLLKKRSKKNKKNFTALSVRSGKSYDETVGSGQLNMLYEQAKDLNTTVFNSNPYKKGCATSYTLVNKTTGQVYRGYLTSVSVVGRTTDNGKGGIMINDTKLSRQHCRFYCSGEGVVIEDLNSTNHTFLNGQMLTSPEYIQPGDSVFIGSAEYVFQYER